MTRKIEKSIVVNVPLEIVYDQWMHFEEFPEFMEGVKEVRQLDDKHLHWVAEIGSKTKEWDAEIVAENKNEVLAWRSTSGAPNQGTVRFRPVSPHESEVNLVVEYDPEGAAENLASWFGVVSARVEGDLKRFKEFVEARGPGGVEGGMRVGGTTPPMQGPSVGRPIQETMPGAGLERETEGPVGTRARTVAPTPAYTEHAALADSTENLHRLADPAEDVGSLADPAEEVRREQRPRRGGGFGGDSKRDPDQVSESSRGLGLGSEWERASSQVDADSEREPSGTDPETEKLGTDYGMEKTKMDRAREERDDRENRY